MKKNKFIMSMTVDAMFLALIAILSFVPYIGYITIGPISFTIIHIIVLIGALLFGTGKGTLYGLFFGLFSLFKALTFPGTLDYLFVNPFVSVLPRVLFGLVSGLVFDCIRKRTTFKNYLLICAPLAVLLTFVHTFLTLTCLYVFGYLDIFQISKFLGISDLIEQANNAFGNFWNFLLACIAPGTVCEIAAGAIISPLLFAALYKGFGKGILAQNGVVLPFREEGEDTINKKSLILIVVGLGVLAVALCAILLVLFYTK